MLNQSLTIPRKFWKVIVNDGSCVISRFATPVGTPAFQIDRTNLAGVDAETSCKARPQVDYRDSIS